ncbi:MULTISPECIES: hypothetical protein [unclassified Mesorhizobium]|uniref:hypothetical protein n=1 Tax=unclassified Mesorhizobium TaxID=325217 RepID=UPI000429887B|nr:MULTISPECIES: hypothetical protein [unclassified Mesorhizobium]
MKHDLSTKPDGGIRDEHATLPPWLLLAGKYPLKIFRTLTTSAALLSAVFLLAGCGHGLINRLI